MNYYEHHIGDYAEATAHLSFTEDAAYSRLIRKYYAQEKCLPPETKAVQRLIGARTKEEREAVETVLEEFFVLESDGWHQRRCDEDLAKYFASQPERETKRENDRERQRRTRERRKELFEQLRLHGVVPKFDAKTTELQALLSRFQSQPVTRDVTQPVTRDNTANQTPDTRHQSPDFKNNNGADAHDSSAGDAEKYSDVCHSAGEISKAMRQFGINSNPGNLLMVELAKQGVSIATVIAACEAAKEKKPNEAIPPAYVIGFIKNWKRDADALNVAGAQQPQQRTTKQDSRAAAAASIGLGANRHDANIIIDADE